MKNSANIKKRKLTVIAVIIGILYLVLQHSMYLLGHTMAELINIPPFSPKIPAIDDSIPIVSVFILPYIWSYVFWAMGPMAVYRCEREHYCDYIVACALSLICGSVVLTFAPTYMDRVAEGLFSVQGTGIFNSIREFWYSLDGSERAYNLLPSFHCMNSMMCFLGVMGRKEISKGFRIYTFIMMMLIFASTVFVKQHFVADVVSGIAIAIIIYCLSKKFHFGRIVPKWIAGKEE